MAATASCLGKSEPWAVPRAAAGVGVVPGTRRGAGAASVCAELSQGPPRLRPQGLRLQPPL